MDFKLVALWLLLVVDLTPALLVGQSPLQSHIRTKRNTGEIIGHVTCDNQMDLYVDGVHQVNDNSWPDSVSVTFTAASKVVAIYCKDLHVAGGILASFDGAGGPMVTDGEWKCSNTLEAGWNTVGFDDSAWGQAHEIGDNSAAMPPWNQVISGISPSAKWIWTTGWQGQDKDVYCRTHINRVQAAVTCDNVMALYVDGLAHGNHADWQTSLSTTIPGATEVVAIHCEDQGVVGGILASFDYNVGLLLTDDEWKCSNAYEVGWETTAFDDSAWASAYEIALNSAAVPPWNIVIPGISPAATWIWTPGYRGQDVDVYCRRRIPTCLKCPCQNGGTCTDHADGGYTCCCERGYFGKDCEHEYGCNSNPCLNGAICTDGGTEQYTCRCQPGFTGTNCETNINECEHLPCLNGGECTDGVDGFTCNCAQGYTGTVCETEIYECESSPCQNNGACQDGVNEYSCLCQDGFVGTHCETDVDECESSPCQNNGCCFDGVNGYKCSCNTGYTGIHCETDVNECDDDPCENGGECANYHGTYKCTCKRRFEGIHCETCVRGCWPIKAVPKRATSKAARKAAKGHSRIKKKR